MKLTEALGLGTDKASLYQTILRRWNPFSYEFIISYHTIAYSEGTKILSIAPSLATIPY